MTVSDRGDTGTWPRLIATETGTWPCLTAMETLFFPRRFETIFLYSEHVYDARQAHNMSLACVIYMLRVSITHLNGVVVGCPPFVLRCP